MTLVSLLPLDGVARGALARGHDDLYRCALGLIDEAMSAPPPDVVRWLAAEPRLTGDRRIDATFAAVAEHVAFHRDLDCPLWVEQPDRFLDRSWFPVDLPSVRVRAFVSSPASFARRLIFIDRSDLSRV